MIEIDGSKGEGGGQIIRSALSLASITGKKVRIYNIRAGRNNPGLRPQHLMACNSVRKICRGTIEGAELGSTELIFSPGKIVGGKYEFNIGTAGSVILVAQTILPILIRAQKKSQIRIIGGTHVMKAPSYDYFEKVFATAIKRFGVQMDCKMIKTGFYPKGGGIIEFSIERVELHGCKTWTSDDEIQAIIRIAGLDQSIAIREKKIFVQNKIENVKIHEEQSLSVGNAITCFKGLRGSYVPGEKGKRAEIVAQEALDNLNKETAEVDLHLADQLVIYGALAKGETEYSTSELSSHLRTNIDVVSRFLDRKIEIKENKIKIC
ncbi:RNA 3'-phosphate cyclase [Candidatus Micrarchaeota archaeon]|nr:RNA 3'-phosphate cyclase [Candidatus Micrarchaeota archaeon]MBU1682152.1 RNA 3'-phosphate cyclase [Candidatus Micrarchaeota archaeon]